ncbi:aspartyl/asparaginyl beta-hydroxylase domain-containing protein [Paraburkholderia rhynchosiae]|nr:aspartyl/asparaginyl beta-hydroxylase domain-containing protein [Paraburkholderia rhynchosiae]
MKLAQVDVTPLMLAIRRRPELWQEDTFLRHYPQGPFGETESIMLRFPKIADFSRDKTGRKMEKYKQNLLPGYDQHESEDKPAFKVLTEARPIVFALMGSVQGERLGRVMINKIVPGGRIFPHADTPVHAEYYSRFHVVLQSQPGVIFRCDDEQVYMATGEVWWFNNKLEHEVINNSADDRIHMIVDIRTSR